MDLIKSVFAETKNEYNEMDEENVLCANYCSAPIEFYPDYAMSKTSYACLRSNSEFVSGQIQAVQVITKPNQTQETETEPVKSSANLYVDYAKEHDDEFWAVNQDWLEENNCCYIADVDHDGADELIVKVGCGVSIYKENNGIAERVFYDRLEDSSGSVSYCLAEYNGEYYIAYCSGGSSEYKKLLVLKDNSLEPVKESMIVDFSEYNINNEAVSKEEYESYVNGISYPEMLKAEEL